MRQRLRKNANCDQKNMKSCEVVTANLGILGGGGCGASADKNVVMKHQKGCGSSQDERRVMGKKLGVIREQ